MTSRPPHFLVTDGSSVIRNVARRICEDLSLRVSDAETGAEALAICGRDMPDALMVEWHLPDMDVLELIRHVRNLDQGQHPKILICMTEFNLALVARAKRAGADDHILKPFDKDVIAFKLKEIGLL